MSALFGFVPALALAAVAVFVVLRAAQRAAVEEREQEERATVERREKARVDREFARIVARFTEEQR